jgi:hypothetical protein
LPVTRQSPFVIELSDDERVELEALVRKPTAQHRMVLRAGSSCAPPMGGRTW